MILAVYGTVVTPHFSIHLSRSSSRPTKWMTYSGSIVRIVDPSAWIIAMAKATSNASNATATLCQASEIHSEGCTQFGGSGALSFSTNSVMQHAMRWREWNLGVMVIHLNHHSNMHYLQASLDHNANRIARMKTVEFPSKITFREICVHSVKPTWTTPSKLPK